MRISCAAFQVLEWTQTIVLIGEAFSGSESSHLRDAMQRHSGKFFQAYHAGNLQVSPLPNSTRLASIQTLAAVEIAHFAYFSSRHNSYA